MPLVSRDSRRIADATDRNKGRSRFAGPRRRAWPPHSPDLDLLHASLPTRVDSRYDKDIDFSANALCRLHELLDVCGPVNIFNVAVRKAELRGAGRSFNFAISDNSHMQSDQVPAVRLARIDELEEAGAIIAASFDSFRASLPPHIFGPYVADASDLAATSDDAAVAVIEHAGRIVGTVTYYEDAQREGMGWPSGYAGLRTLAVAPEAQGHGYGRKLCQWCIDRAREQQAEALALHTAEFMKSACWLYESLGFQRRPRHDLVASGVLGFDPARGDQRIIAYEFPLDERISTFRKLYGH